MRYPSGEVIAVQKSATLNLRVDPEVKRSAESVLARLGISTSTTVDMFLRQVSLTGAAPSGARYQRRRGRLMSAR
ncbi:type II toxin-antitoxin system RelB/DinJ family antitoxin [Actinomyces qiguomingii]